MSIKSNLLKNAGASLWGKLSSVILRLLQVPLLLSALGVDDFGRWLVLYSFPAFLLLGNLGFGSVAVNEMSMSVAAGNVEKARSVFSTTLAVLAGIGILGTILVVIIIPYIPFERLFQFPVERHHETTSAATWMAITVFISFFAEAFYGRFWAARKAHLAVLFASILPWLDLSAIFIALKFSRRFDHIAIALLCSCLLYIIIIRWFSRRALPALSFSITEIKVDKFRLLFRKGLAFMGFPVGNALLYQGQIMIVQSVLGPAAVALFGTVRTLIRTVYQVMEMINQATWPEFSHLLGAKDYVRAAKLHRGIVGVTIIVTFSGAVLLAIFGQYFYNFWVGKSIDLPQHLLLLFLLPIPFNALWFTSSVVHVAVNQHEGMAMRYLIATVLSAITCVVLSRVQGMEGAALSSVVVDLMMIPYVFKKSLWLTYDNWNGFLNGIVQEVRNLPGLLKRKFN